MASIEQGDFSAGIFRGRRAPKNSVYDALNGLISDEGEMFRRGGSEYKSGGNAEATLLGLWDGYTVAGQRTLFWSADSVEVLDSNDSSVIELLDYSEPVAGARGVELGGIMFCKATNGNGNEPEFTYAGSRKTAEYTTGTISGTAGSTTITGSGTSWLANVDPGMILAFRGVVKSVTSDTSLELVRPLSHTVSAGTAYGLTPYEVANPFASATVPDASASWYYAVAGARLIRVIGNRAYFSRPLSDDSFYAVGSSVGSLGTIADRDTDFHEIPRGATVVGADSIQDTALIFTTGGIWAISNLALDAVDAFGNIQHQVAQISQDIVLWGDAGLAARENALIIPAIDDVYAFTPGAQPVPLSQGIRPLYREYVEAGYKPGLATVYRGHYILPVLDSSNAVIDTLVCRLDRGPAWTRWANGASGRAYARRVGSTTREPKLLGLDGLRVSDLTGCLDPDATRKDDADGTDHALTVTTNDYPLGPGLQKGHCIRVRANYSLVDAATDNPTTVMQWSRGPEGSSFTTVTAVRGGGESDGTEYSSWPINKAAEFIRFKWATSGAATSAVLRKIEVLFRPYGKQ